jgi:lysine decarboxylase
MKKQDSAPILETLTAYISRGVYPFHTPGHKGGRFTPPELVDLWGPTAFAYDLPAMTATDNTLHPTHCVKEAQELAAELFGAAATFYTGMGASTGVAAMVLAAVPPGETILLPRNVHRSVASALVLSGARPQFLPHDVLPECGALGVSADAVEAAILGVACPRPRGHVEGTKDMSTSADLRVAATQHLQNKKPAAILLTRPTYYGLARTLEPVAAVCRKHGIPLLVDEAHGPHLKFLPPGAPTPAPTPALDAGADLVAQSCHKTLGSLVGTAQIHVGHNSPVSPEQLRDALNFLQTTSPNYLQLASLDANRRYMAREGRELFRTAVADASELAAQIGRLPGLKVLSTADDPRLADHTRDPLRLVVNVAGAGWTGYDAELLLRTQYAIEDELADWFNVALVLSPHDDAAARQRLLAGLKHVSDNPRTRPASSIAEAANLLQPGIPPLAMTPREAALGPKTPIALAESVGRVCAESVMFYPPGIPLLMPGEIVTAEILEVCRALLAGGAHCYAADPTLATMRVVRD